MKEFLVMTELFFVRAEFLEVFTVHTSLLHVQVLFCQGLILRGFHCAYIIAACASFTLTCHCS